MGCDPLRDAAAAQAAVDAVLAAVSSVGASPDAATATSDAATASPDVAIASPDAASPASPFSSPDAAPFAAAAESLARARRDDDARRRRMARTLAGVLAHVAHGFDDTHGRYLMYALFLSVTTPLQRFQRVFSEQRLLSMRLNLFKCDLGVVVYTIAHAQLNVNVAAPCKRGNSLALVNSFLAYLPKVPHHASCALDMRALRSHVSFKENAKLFRPRRFVRTRDDVAEVEYDPVGRTLSLHGHTLLSEGVLHHREEVAFYKPLCRAAPEDALDAVYWHRTRDGPIVLTTNPLNGAVDADFEEVLLDHYDFEVFAPASGAGDGAGGGALSGAEVGGFSGAEVDAANGVGADAEDAGGAAERDANARRGDGAAAAAACAASAAVSATTRRTEGRGLTGVDGEPSQWGPSDFGAVGSVLIAVLSANDGLQDAHDLCCAMLYDVTLPLLLRTEVFRHVAFTLCTLDDDLAKHGGALLHVFRISCGAVDAICAVQDCTRVLELNRDVPEAILVQGLRGVVHCSRTARKGGSNPATRVELGVGEEAIASAEAATRLAEVDVEAGEVATAFRRWWASSGVLSCFAMLLPLSTLTRLWREEGDCIAALIDRMLLATLQVWEPAQSQKAGWLVGKGLACIQVRDEIVRRTRTAEYHGEQCVVDADAVVGPGEGRVSTRTGAKRRGNRGRKGAKGERGGERSGENSGEGDKERGEERGKVEQGREEQQQEEEEKEEEGKGEEGRALLGAAACVGRASTASSWSLRRRAREPQAREREAREREAREPTYHDLVARMAREFGIDVTLIGSGIFYRARDADVVVRVEGAASLQAAYDAVARCTGWVPTEGVVTGERLVVLHGTYEGVAVDAQVHRGDGGDTVSEQTTRRALRVNACLETGLDAERRAAVQVLHEWAHVAGESGHQLCRLPGIALTCIAVVATRADARQHGVDARRRRLRRLLEALCSALRCSAPVVDLGTQSMSDCAQPGFAQRGAAPSQTPLRVLVCGEEGAAGANVASRMTGATTRELLATVAAALQRSDEALLDGEAYSRWRDAELVVAAYATPRDASITPRTLPAVLARLEGHPCIERVWVGDGGADRVRVLVGVRAGADASVYGLREGDAWERVEEEGNQGGACVRVRRVGASASSVSFRLTLSPRAGRANVREAWDASARVSDVYAVEGTDAVIPNMPTIAYDVCAAFCGARGWSVDVV